MENSSVQSRPVLNTEDIPALVHDIYGLQVSVIRELDSYDDKNFLVKIVPDSTLPANLDAVSDDGYVLKVLNPIDSRNDDVIDCQTQIILQILKSGVPTSRPVPTQNGTFQKLQLFPQTKGHCVVRLFEYVPGHVLSQVTLTSSLCHQVGQLAANLNLALKDFVPQEECLLSKMRNKWNMSEIPMVHNALSAISDLSQKELVADVIQVFTARVLCQQELFAQGLIHGDFNDGNIIVSSPKMLSTTESMKEGQTPGTNDVAMREAASPGTQQDLIQRSGDTASGKDYKEVKVSSCCEPNNVFPESNELFPNKEQRKCHPTVTGVIDFGDACHTPYIFELAIAMMYVMISSKSDVSPTEAAAHVLDGYLSHFELPLFDLTSLRVCVCARLAQSFTYGHFVHAMEPENEYLMTHAKQSWNILCQFWLISDAKFFELLKPLCKNQIIDKVHTLCASNS